MKKSYNVLLCILILVPLLTSLVSASCDCSNNKDERYISLKCKIKDIVQDYDTGETYVYTDNLNAGCLVFKNVSATSIHDLREHMNKDNAVVLFYSDCGGSCVLLEVFYEFGDWPEFGLLVILLFAVSIVAFFLGAIVGCGD